MVGQAVDQAGFRTGFSCDDHLFVVTLLSGLFEEYRLPLWAVAADFRKAFDSITHDKLCNSLYQQGVPKVYTHVLRRLYTEKSAQVQTYKLSKAFSICRGTRQGDPLSPILFNSALEDLMRQLTPSWVARGRGIEKGGRMLANLRFADVLFLLAPTADPARGMLEDLILAAATYGLEVHDKQTKFLWNRWGECPIQERWVQIQNASFEILQSSE